MKRMSISLNEDVYLFIQESIKDKYKFRNASHFVEDCVRVVMSNTKKKQ